MLKSTRREFLSYSSLFAGSAMFQRTLFAVSLDAEKPNIILCMTDDQGWGDTGYNGHPVLRTPNLDQMAEDGIRFDRFYSGAPVCSPTQEAALPADIPIDMALPSLMKGT